jgi:hypothetical protein
MDDLGERLIDATVSALRPLAKQLLAHGVPFGRLEARLRALFVAVAEAELALPGRRQTDSRIALLTGINRKEVRRIRSAEATGAPKSFSMNHAASLISRWRTDSQTTDAAGRPLPLPYQARRGPSFTKLARKVTRDLAPRVLLDELVRSGAVEVRAAQRIALIGTAYVPAPLAAEKLQILAEDPAELIETILRNVFAEAGELLLQRKVYYDNLGGDAALRIRAEMRREGERFLHRVDRMLARYDRDRNPKAAGGPRLYAGMGVYFFEGPAAPPPGHGPQRSAARVRRSKERKQ